MFATSEDTFAIGFGHSALGFTVPHLMSLKLRGHFSESAIRL